ncbi:hypothetical protein A3K02_00525 [candidate division WS6 bacterium RIFOXYD1_FULL_33_8]|nr:MAG: hypothetical protein UR49_C0008G0014 [candidate division WS6 bacterium GW2011_GWF2_33_92]OGC36671.1 MAG: hypothetical protein A2369_01830 [candidate division WS6 bacterium RIFOXYB1_FULL_33_15]OGC42827.1 MAG: hypothetical protein A3K02_00525 [candidate division WS6 bacterium RIFOXYD1_FULL_33_8]
MDQKEINVEAESKIGESFNGISMTRDEFYRELTISSSKFITAEIQEKFRNTEILIAGVGSVGNPIAMTAVRAGAERVTVMDPDVVEANNLSRQQYTVSQIGKSKADMTVENMKQINPYIADSIHSEAKGMTIENAREYVEKSDIVVDAVDIRALDVIYELHKCAAELRKPVLVGYDLAGTAMVAVYRYDKENIKPLRGELDDEKILEFNKVKLAFNSGILSESEFLDYIYDAFTGPIDPLRVPVEQLEEIIKRTSEDTRTYQIGTTSAVLASLTVEAMRRIVSNEGIKDVILVDIPGLVRRSNPNVISKIPLLLRTLAKVKERGENVRESLNKII